MWLPVPIDRLKQIENLLRTAPRKIGDTAALVVELPDDTVTSICEFLREVIDANGSDTKYPDVR